MGLHHLDNVAVDRLVRTVIELAFVVHLLLLFGTLLAAIASSPLYCVILIVAWFVFCWTWEALV